ncbi:hypothetical protein BFC18_09485 [Alteromonas confluentis]|uniref:YecA family protein n=1 Tax=Alteromonas confluentis TaxID=1656094 RepID=A0A1E7ZCX2_9ALTE|nr:hypothetical protein BFC18_09485 [Alteromonas confluentis]
MAAINQWNFFVEKQLDYDRVTNTLSQYDVIADGAELQGILCGMLSGGMPVSERKWLDVLKDTLNQGAAFPPELENMLTDVFNSLCQQLVEAEFTLSLMLPDDKAPINDRGLGLINWVQGFMLGFGLYQQDMMQCSEDVKEALQDFSDIARMEEPMTEDEESERALFEVVEYVKISALLCFNELGQSLIEDQKDKPSVH